MVAGAGKKIAENKTKEKQIEAEKSQLVDRREKLIKNPDPFEQDVLDRHIMKFEQRYKQPFLATVEK